MKIMMLQLDLRQEIAVELSNQYIFNKKLPDKAFDIIDRACAFNRILPLKT